MARLMERYKNELVPVLREELGVANVNAVPRLQKVVVSMGTGSPTQDKNRLATVSQDLAKITGQKPQVRRAKRAVSNFKTRAGYEVGCRVTLRGRRMYEFVDRLFNVAIPRVRDFRGLNPRSFDGRGNYNMGVTDQSIFGEIDLGDITYNQGMNITFVTSARSDADAKALLAHLGLPLRQPEV
jgi:large subunit ribosomal protein L5